MTNQFTLTDTFQVAFTKLPLGLVLNYDKDPDSDDDQEYYCGVRAVLPEAAEAKAQGVEKHMVLVAVNGAKCSEEESLADVIRKLKALPCTATFDRSDKARAMCSRMEREADLRKERKTRKRQQKEEQQRQLAAMRSAAAMHGSAYSGVEPYGAAGSAPWAAAAAAAAAAATGAASPPLQLHTPQQQAAFSAEVGALQQADPRLSFPQALVIVTEKWREELEQHQARVMQHQLHTIRQQIDQVLPTMTAAVGMLVAKHVGEPPMNTGDAYGDAATAASQMIARTSAQVAGILDHASAFVEVVQAKEAGTASAGFSAQVERELNKRARR